MFKWLRKKWLNYQVKKEVAAFEAMLDEYQSADAQKILAIIADQEYQRFAEQKMREELELTGRIARAKSLVLNHLSNPSIKH